MQKLEGGVLDPKIAALVTADESPVFAASPTRASFGRGEPLKLPTLLLTNRRLLISKDRWFNPRIDLEVDWSNVGSVEGTLSGSGRSIQLFVRDIDGSELVEFMISNQYAVEVESAIRSGYMNTREAR